MKTYELRLHTIIILTIMLIIVPFIPGMIIGYSVGIDTGYDLALRQVMRMKNSEQFDRLSPDVKAALSRMERVKISATTIAGAGDEHAR